MKALPLAARIYVCAIIAVGATVLVVVVITYVSIVIGELVPKRLGQIWPEAIARRVLDLHDEGALALLGHRRNQERRTEHVLVADIEHLGIVREIHEQRTHERRAAVVGVLAQRIHVRDQRVAQLQIFADHRLRFLAKRPRLGFFAQAVVDRDGDKLRRARTATPARGGDRRPHPAQAGAADERRVGDHAASS